MQLKEIYDESIFKSTIALLFEEHGENVYSFKRRNDELNGLINKTIIMCCLTNKEEILGHISFRKPNSEDTVCSVVSVFINKEHRAKGYGKIMLAEFEKFAKSLGFNKIVLGARRGKENFYYSCGYQGEALLQADKEVATKQELKNILINCKLPQNKYVFRNEQIHQYYFDARKALNSKLLLDTVDNSNSRLGLVVVFSKDL